MYPVERQHKFPSEAPKREKSAGADELKYPVHANVEKKHGFKDTAPAAYKIEKLQGTVFTCGDANSSSRADIQGVSRLLSFLTHPFSRTCVDTVGCPFMY